MSTPPPPTRIRSAVAQWWTGGADVAVAVLFWIVIGIIAVVATASSKSKWDTVIAAIAMGSQAFFAAAVWRLGKNQFAFTKRVAERQLKIDSFDLREKAADRLEEMSIFILPPKPITDHAVEAFRYCHLEISRLFSDEADNLAFNLYELVQDAQRYMRPAPPVIDSGGSIVAPGDEGMTPETLACLNEAIDVYTDLQNLLSDEMRIR